jgi:hypothetical protein
LRRTQDNGDGKSFLVLRRTPQAKKIYPTPRSSLYATAGSDMSAEGKKKREVSGIFQNRGFPMVDDFERLEQLEDVA